MTETNKTPDPMQDLIDSLHKALTEHCHWCRVFSIDYDEPYCPDHVHGPTQGLEQTIEALELWAPWFRSPEMYDAIIHLRFYSNLLPGLRNPYA